MPALLPTLTAACALLLAGCDGLQSALSPAGPRAERIADVWWLMFWGAAAVLALVVGLACWTMLPRAPRARFNANLMIIAGGIVLPLATLTGLLVYGYRIGALHESPVTTRLSVEVIGQRFWWRFRYPDTDVEVAGVLHIPVGEPVEVRLATRDVIHSFWVPRLAGKLDLIPGRENRMWLQASEPGVFRGQCAEFCGAQHALMALVVVAQPREEFDRWLAAEQAPAALTAGPGFERFAAAGCADCHRIRGSSAGGGIGPDLTHIGSRWQIAARHAPGAPQSLAEWIRVSHWSVDAQLRPDPERLAEADMAAIADYLEQLR